MSFPDLRRNFSGKPSALVPKPQEETENGRNRREEASQTMVQQSEDLLDLKPFDHSEKDDSLQRLFREEDFQGDGIGNASQTANGEILKSLKRRRYSEEDGCEILKIGRALGIH